MCPSGATCHSSFDVLIEIFHYVEIKEVTVTMVFGGKMHGITVKNKNLTSVLASCRTPEYEYGKSPYQAVNRGCRKDSPFFTSDLCRHGTSWYKSLYISSASVGSMKFGKNLILEKRL